MAYSASADIQKMLNATDLQALTDDDLSGAIDADVVTRAIADADEEIDLFLTKRYSLPLSSTPEIVRKLSVDIAVYNLYCRRGEAPQTWRDRYGRAKEILTDIRDGKLALDGFSEAATVTISSTRDEDDKVFTDDNLDGFTDE